MNIKTKKIIMKTYVCKITVTVQKSQMSFTQMFDITIWNPFRKNNCEIYLKQVNDCLKEIGPLYLRETSCALERMDLWTALKNSINAKDICKYIHKKMDLNYKV